MSPSQIVLKESAPLASEFANLRSAIGWNNPQLDVVQKSIDSTLFWVTLYLGNELIGAGRVIGDGAMYFYVQDVIVHPSHQKFGLGAQIMQSIDDFIKKACAPGSTVGLLSVQGKEQFYQKYGFVPRNGQNLGLGMCRFI